MNRASTKMFRSFLFEAIINTYTLLFFSGVSKTNETSVADVDRLAGRLLFSSPFPFLPFLSSGSSIPSSGRRTVDGIRKKEEDDDESTTV